jgi:hypothetical protein
VVAFVPAIRRRADVDDLPGAKLQFETQSRVSRRLNLRLAVLFEAATSRVAISQGIEIIQFSTYGVDLGQLFSV